MAGLAIFPACQPSGKQAQMSPSEKLFNNKCRSCHALPKPGSRSADEWNQVMAKHSGRVTLTTEQIELILGHVRGAPRQVAAETE